MGSCASFQLNKFFCLSPKSELGWSSINLAFWLKEKEKEKKEGREKITTPVLMREPMI